ncbi:hypothetical protein HanPSC8_Chr11g0486731 [Helianthus annuus]|nr:hypothetical protein HanPSC8_Chr11g0486731 [Helianthus annuus]
MKQRCKGFHSVDTIRKEDVTHKMVNISYMPESGKIKYNSIVGGVWMAHIGTVF